MCPRRVRDLFSFFTVSLSRALRHTWVAQSGPTLGPVRPASLVPPMRSSFMRRRLDRVNNHAAIESRRGEIGADIIPMSSDSDVLTTRAKITFMLIHDNEMIDVTSRRKVVNFPRLSLSFSIARKKLNSTTIIYVRLRSPRLEEKG